MIKENEMLKIIEKYQFSKVDESTFLDIKNEINANSEINCTDINYVNNSLLIDFSNGSRFEAKFDKKII